MNRLPRSRSATVVFLVACSLCLGAVQNQPEIRRLVDGPASRSLVQVLSAGNMRTAAQALAYPANYSASELETDTKSVAEALRVLHSHFGQLSATEPEVEVVQFYEVGVGTGPQPFWWESSQPPSQTRQYIYRARFSRAGPGFIKILTRTTPGGEQPVSIYFGLSVSLPSSKARIEAAYQSLLDGIGLPAGHPARPLGVDSWQAPPASPN